MELSISQQSDILSFLHSNRVNSIGTYTFEKTIGEGSFGKVKLAYHNLTGQKTRFIHPHLFVKYSSLIEIETWRQLHHPNIAQLFEVLTSESKIYMVTEYCNGGELLEYITQNGRMDDTEAETVRVFMQIAEAVHKCHEMNFAHRDLKLENILLTDDLQVKLIDFGFTRLYDEKVLLDTYCGSSAYCAPEIVAGQKYSGPEADIWSLGVVLYTIVCGYLPFDADTDADTHKQIQDIKYELPDFLSNEVSDLIRRIFKKIPSERITLLDIFNHPWVKKANYVSSSEQLAPMLGTTRMELALAAKLEAAGLNVPGILNSVHSNACDQSSALWHLLLSKQSLCDTRSSMDSIHIKVQEMDQYFEEAQQTPVSDNPLLHIVSSAKDQDDMQHSDPLLATSRQNSKKGKKEKTLTGTRPHSASIQWSSNLKNSVCLEEEEDNPLKAPSPLGESFSATYKPRPHSAGTLRPASVRRKPTQDTTEGLPLVEEPTDEEIVRPLRVGSLRISNTMRKTGIQEEEEPTSPFH